MGLDLIEPGSFRVVPDGWAVDVRLAWYRSLPLSCIERCGSRSTAPGRLTTASPSAINGREWPLAALPELVDEVWFVTDCATRHRPRGAAPAAGESHALEAEIAFRAPYIAIGPDRFLVRTDQFATTQTALA